MPSTNRPEVTELRIDRWLWTARLFRTRTLAAEAISKGRVALNGSRAKASKTVRAGDRITVRRPPHVIEIEVRGIAQRRVSATLAAGLYAETADSVAARTALDDTLALDRVVEQHRFGKLNKKERRQRDEFKRGLS